MKTVEIRNSFFCALPLLLIACAEGINKTDKSDRGEDSYTYEKMVLCDVDNDAIRDTLRLTAVQQPDSTFIIDAEIKYKAGNKIKRFDVNKSSGALFWGATAVSNWISIGYSDASHFEYSYDIAYDKEADTFRLKRYYEVMLKAESQATYDVFEDAVLTAEYDAIRICRYDLDHIIDETLFTVQPSSKQCITIPYDKGEKVLAAKEMLINVAKNEIRKDKSKKSLIAPK